MIPYERREKIMTELEKEDIIYIDDFLKVFDGVSESTIRRDIKSLEEEGLIVALRGGAVKAKINSYDIPVGTKKLLYTEEKEKIGKLAASLIEDGEVIYIDSGTTCSAMVRHIKAKNVKIITTNLQVLNELDDKYIDKCIIVGGEVNKNLDSVAGPLTDTTLQNLNFDKAFVGASGFGFKAGVNTPEFTEANKKSIVKDNSKKCYVLADSSKFNKSTLCKAFELSEATLITNEFIDSFENKLKYMIAD